MRSSRASRTFGCHGLACSGGVERLEERWLCAIVASDAVVMSDMEQLLLELVNRARIDPQGEAVRFGIDLNEGLEPGTITPIAKPALAPHPALIQAAGDYAEWMLEHDYFEHNTPDGRTPSDRARAAGYPGGAGENIAFKGRSTDHTPAERIELVYEEHKQLFLSHGHRENLMTPHYREIGTGVRFGKFFTTDKGDLFAIMVAEEFSLRGGDHFLTGVAYNDAVIGNQFYEIGEGLANVTISATRPDDPLGTVYTTTTGPSGGYSLQVPNGVYQVTASGGNLSAPWSVSNVIVNNQNTKVDVNTRQLTISSLRGFAFNDFNQNGTQDAGETPLANQSLYLDANQDGRRSPGEASVNTNASGAFQFAGLLPGTYVLSADLPSTWRVTSGANRIEVQLTTGNPVSAGHRLAIYSPNTAPLTLPDAFQVVQATSHTVDPFANDVDVDSNLVKTTWQLVVAPERGLLEYSTTTGAMTYTPQPTFVGTDHFQYRVSDGRGAVSNVSTVTLTVGNPGGRPYQNATNVFDVNESGGVTPLDALAALEEINAREARALPLVRPAAATTLWVDVNGDGYISAIDPLLILNAIQRSIRMRDAILAQQATVVPAAALPVTAQLTLAAPLADIVLAQPAGALAQPSGDWVRQTRSRPLPRANAVDMLFTDPASQGRRAL